MESSNDLQAPVQVPLNLEGVNIHLSYIRRDLEGLNKKLDIIGAVYVTHEEFRNFKEDILKKTGNCVSLEEFSPIKKLVFGSVGLILSSVLVAIIYLVVRK